MRVVMLFAMACAATGCRGLLGIEEAVVGDAGAGSDAMSCRAPGCPCLTHAGCDSEVCLASASCENPNNVAYVAETGLDSTCMQIAPCASLVTAAATNRPTIKVTGDITDLATATFNGGRRAIYGAPNATVTNAGPGSVITVLAATDLTIYDLVIYGAEGADAHGVFINDGSSSVLRVLGCRIYGNEGAGIRTEGGLVFVDRTIIAGNFIVGIQLDSTTFTITNTIIVQNGNPGDVPGGASLDPGPGSRFELNTVDGNISADVLGARVAIECVAGTTLDNIIASDTLAGACDPRFSLLETMPTGGSSNFGGTPDFEQTTNMMLPTYYRLLPTSDAIDRGTTTMVRVDIDGDPRTNGMIDVGADEYVP